MTRSAVEASGRRAEQLAAALLRCKGYHILARRLRTPRGEIDLLAARGQWLVFVEVKRRASLAAAAAALTPQALKRVTAAVQVIAPRWSTRFPNQRVDAILVAPWRLPRHLKNIVLG